MKPASDVTACVCDHGLFLPMAQALSRHYKKVYYWSPFERSMPSIKDGCVGDGFNEIERVSSPWDVKGGCDLFVFPDVGFTGIQKEILSQGIPVWGHMGADELEVNRGLFLDTLKRIGLSVPEYKAVTGGEALLKELRNKEDRYIKCSRWRGDWETMHWRSYEEDAHVLTMELARLGPLAEMFKFYVFDPIDTEIEDGIDTYCIGGSLPTLVMHGMEHKDKSYLCSVQPYDDIDERVRAASDKLAPILGNYGMNGFFSTEVRVTEDDSYFIDPTIRCGSPPSQVMVEMFGNLGEIVWHGAHGICVDPIPTAKYGAQVLISGHADPDDWTVIKMPDELRQWVKCGFACGLDDAVAIPPGHCGHMLGWLVATGDTIEDTIDTLKERADLLPCGVDCDVTSLAHLLSEASEAKEQGIEISKEEIPEPSEVING